MDTAVRTAVLCNFLLAMFIYLTTPHLQSFGLSGNLDALCVALFAVGLGQIFFLFGRSPGALCFSAIILLAIVFNLSSGLYLQQQQYYLSAQTFYLVSEMASLLTSFGTEKVFAGVASFCVLFGFLFFLSRRAQFNGRTWSGVVGSALCLGVFGLQMIYLNITREENFNSAEATPIGFLVRSTGAMPFVNFDREWVAEQERNTLLEKILGDPSAPLPDKYSVKTIQDSLGRDFQALNHSIDPKYPLYTRYGDSGKGPAETDIEGKNYNVLVLVLESVRASEMGVYGAAESATPFLDSLAADNIFASKFYATSNFTVKTEHAIHCSLYDFMIGSPVSTRGIPVKSECLPEILDLQYGYQTLWFHGNEKEFYDRSDYLPKIGFRHIFSKEELTENQSLPVLGWGISDPVLFDIALSKLESVEGPFYSEILSVSNHLPFDYEWGINFPDHLAAEESMYERYRRGIYYTDQAVKSFYKKFSESHLASDTVLIVTGDHGIWTFSDDSKSELQKNEEFFRVPLIVVTPESEISVVDGNHSHLDIAPTIIDILGIEVANTFIGESMFSLNPKKAGRTLYQMTEQALSYRFKDRACIPTVQCENSVNCYKTYEIEPAGSQCFLHNEEDDLLWMADDLDSNGTEPSADERVLFDYSQLALELGTMPQPKASSVLSATLAD